MAQLCEICASREARYVCGRCGRRVCAQDFAPKAWLCASCEQITPAKAPASVGAYPFGLSWIILASFALVLVGMIMMIIASMTQGQGTTSGGAVILIGPIPIILGGGPQSGWLILLGAIITVVAFAAFLLAKRETHR